jgi:heme-degrading monooxygenase HmoA
MVNLKNPNEMVIISTWENQEAWDNWYESAIRKDYYNKLRAVLESGEEIAFYSVGAAK